MQPKLEPDLKYNGTELQSAIVAYIPLKLPYSSDKLGIKFPSSITSSNLPLNGPSSIALDVINDLQSDFNGR